MKRHHVLHWIFGVSVLVLGAIVEMSCSRESKHPLEPATDYSYIDSFSRDAIVLAARMGDSPWIDIRLVATIEDVLERARPLRPQFAEIGAFPDFVPKELIAMARSDLALRWRWGHLTVGDAYLDSLSAMFRLVGIEELFSDWFLLTFAHSLNIPYVAELYDRSFPIIYAEPNYTIGDGDRIYLFNKSNVWHLVFSEGGGDCPSGCTWRTYYYLEVPAFGPIRLIEEWGDGIGPPASRIYRWNIPERFAAAHFGTADSLLSYYTHTDWWARRHAVEATRGFFDSDSPHYGEDIGPVWYEMRAELDARGEEIGSRLDRMRSDPDPDVRGSVALALEAL
ncbi:MAG: hypothetical protein KAY32_03255 [Candidatus Eisenbacteria sp.]|nr:hypothetical protein [Candidatus Eisenbacteria bacterium]